MSYLQLDIQVLDRAPVVAAMAGIDPAQLLWGLTQTWAQCWRDKTAELHPAFVWAHFGLRDPLEAQKLLAALELGEFVAKQPSGMIRVRGAEKRLGLLKARQKAAAKARGQEAPQTPEAPQEPARAIPEPATQPVPGSHPMGPETGTVKPEPKGMTPAKDIVGRLFGALSQGAANEDGQNGQHQPAQRHEPPTPAAAQQPGPDSAASAAPGKEAASPGPQDAPIRPGHPGGPVEPAPSPAKEPKPTSEHQALIDRLTASFQRIRGAKYGFSGRDAKAVADLRQRYAADDIVARWESALQTEGYKGCSAIHELPAKWNHHTNRSNAAPTSQQLAPSDDEWDRQMMAAAKRLGAPQGWHRDQQWLKKVQTAAYETWAHKELERHQAGVPHDT